MVSDLTGLCITPDSSIHQATACINRNRKGIVLIINEEGQLLGTITDGDLRRAILTGVNLDLPVKVLLDQRAPMPYPQPFTAPVGTLDAELLHLMNKHSIRHIPLLDKDERVVGVALLSELVKEYELPLRAVVMAGGYGIRLRPLTEQLPKPMLPVGDRPLLELIIEQLRQAGIHQVNLTTHYKAEIIARHFGDGKDFGVKIRYVEEDRPLGTAGAISLMESSDEPLLVINGDILTQVDFCAMLDFHRDYQAEMTVAVREYEFRVPYGVVETDGIMVMRISEKPVMRYFVNAGIYLLNPQVRRLIPNGQPYDMPDLITRLVKKGRRVVSFPVREYWLDIGQLVDYQRALADVENQKV